MSHPYDSAAIANHFGIPEGELGIELVPYELDGVEYENVLFYDKRRSGPMKGALVVPNFFGVRQQSLDIAATTLGPGYAVLVADVYGKTLRPATREEAAAKVVALKKDRAELRKRMNAALQAFQSQEVITLSDIGACGYCFGGTATLELARSGAKLKAFATLHGGLDTRTPDDAKNIKGAILVLHGVQDPSVPPEQVNAFMAEMSAANVDWQLTSYGLAGHSYTDPGANNPGYFYHEPTARRAAIALRNFFEEMLA